MRPLRLTLRTHPDVRPCSTIYDVAPGILGSFDKSLAEYATAKFVREGIQIKGSRHVTAVHEGYLEIKEEGKGAFLSSDFASGD